MKKMIVILLAVLILGSCTTADPSAFYPSPWVMNEGEHAVRNGLNWYRFDSDNRLIEKAKARTSEELQEEVE